MTIRSAAVLVGGMLTALVVACTQITFVQDATPAGPDGSLKALVLDTNAVRLTWSSGTDLSHYEYAATTDSGTSTDTTEVVNLYGGEVACVWGVDTEGSATADTVCRRIATDSATRVRFYDRLHLYPKALDLLWPEQSSISWAITLHRDSLWQSDPIGCYGPECWRWRDSLSPALYRYADTAAFVLTEVDSVLALTTMP